MTQVEAPRTVPAFDAPGPNRRPPAFAHASEAELARIFDFYALRWEYEPHLFPLQWNLDGVVVESFAPDFFLPDIGLYVELTTLRQPLVRKKNRKLRRLRELYPDVRIKLLYARDFRALMLKYGKGALIGALSGTSGQVVPSSPDPADVKLGPAAAAASAVAPAVTEPIAAASDPAPARRVRRRRPERSAVPVASAIASVKEPDA